MDQPKNQENSGADANLDFEFEDSSLGTKEYWDRHYDSELTIFEETGDEGEIWFGRSSESRMLKFLLERVPLDAHISDLGTGNGSLLRKLQARGFRNLCGLDYSAKAIELAKRTTVASTTKIGSSDSEASEIEFQVSDLTAERLSTELLGRFDILLDKGTLDAIALNSERQILLKNYQSNICQLFRNHRAEESSTDSDDSPLERQKRLLLIISCNFTKDELVDLLQNVCLQFDSEMPTTGSAIQFGGKMGNTTTGIVFRYLATGH